MWRTKLYCPSAPNSALKVLLVEDSEDDAFFFGRALEKTGMRSVCIRLSDGAEAVEYLKAARSGAKEACPIPDIIFLDLKLPAMTGFEVLAWITEQDFNPPLHVAVLSGSDQETDVKDAGSLGAREYLVKPLAAEDLKQRLLVAMDAAQAPPVREEVRA